MLPAVPQPDVVVCGILIRSEEVFLRESLHVLTDCLPHDEGDRCPAFLTAWVRWSSRGAPHGMGGRSASPCPGQLNQGSDIRAIPQPYLCGGRPGGGRCVEPPHATPHMILNVDVFHRNTNDNDLIAAAVPAQGQASVARLDLLCGCRRAYYAPAGFMADCTARGLG